MHDHRQPDLHMIEVIAATEVIGVAVAVEAAIVVIAEARDFVEAAIAEDKRARRRPALPASYYATFL
jgi:hypothetical protein